MHYTLRLAPDDPPIASPVVEQQLRHEHAGTLLGHLLGDEVGIAERIAVRQLRDLLLEPVYAIEERFVIFVGCHNVIIEPMC